MSHFTVLVCLPATTDPTTIEQTIGERLARWDENRDVEPYRDFEDGTAEEFWWVSSVRRGAEHHRNGTGILPHYPDDPHGIKHAGRCSRQTEDEQRAELADDAIWADKLGEHPTWETVAKLYNEKYHPTNALAVAGDTSDSERLLYDAESDRAYTISTRNPEGLWDWWALGGRWHRTMIGVQGADRSVLVFGRAGLFGDRGNPERADNGGLYCDGGPRFVLDFKAMRDKAAVEANARYDLWDAICEKADPAKPWSHFSGLAQVKEITWDEARAQYGEQERIRLTHQNEDLRWLDCPVEHFMSGREEYVEEARRGAVPGYALVTLEGDWLAPGRMGWFGMSSEGEGERSAFRVGVNRYLDDMDPQTYVVLVDCHV
ncbi:hypothetical protein OOJ91_11995 [Micromonospora lupini]|uniref:hypothetical protein n=1 Tax=Micromonospora lupini TaxID=285679 RepID=UPI00224DD071|nr:hypothetical protein [Micromonospora lupini]MCX5066599.1 hypothetical protein [Micromonospora lupini]